MKTILITSRDPCLKFDNPTGPGKSIQLLIPLIKNYFNIYLFSTEEKKNYLYFFDKKENKFLKKNLLDIFKIRFDLIYINGVFSIIYCFLPLFLKSRFLISPRGMLGEEAFEFKTIRKKVYIFFLRKLIIFRKARFISSSEKETQELKLFLEEFTEDDIVEIANLTGFKFKNNDNITSEINVNIKLEKTFKFITPSTISRKKNLLNTIKALDKISDKIKFTYDIYGSVNDFGYYKEIKNFITKRNMENVTLKKPVRNEELQKKYKEYDAMLLFTRGENFGHVIPESAGALLPFLISNKTPWNYFDKYFFGMICDEEILLSIENCILNFTKLNEESLFKLKRATQIFYNDLVDEENVNIRKFKALFENY